MGDNLNVVRSRIIGFETLPEYIRDLFNTSKDDQDKLGNTVLHKYVLYNKFFPGVLQELINRGTNLEIENEQDRTAFLEAAVHRNKFMIQTFIENGANVHTIDCKRQNALHYLVLTKEVIASSSGAVENLGTLGRSNATFSIFESLLQQGVNVNLQNHHGNTPLMLAAYRNHLKIVKMLLKHGANVNVQNSYSETCLHKASNSRKLNANVPVEQNADIICELIRKGSSINCFDYQKLTPLGCILQSRHADKDYFAKQFLTVASLAHWEERITFYISRTRILERLPKYKYLVDHVEACYVEIGRMAGFRLSEASNLCQFALGGVSEQDIASEVYDRVFHICLREVFPIYNDFILSSFERSYLERKLSELDVFKKWESRKYSSLPEMISIVLSLLKNKDLFNVFKAFSLQPLGV